MRITVFTSNQPRHVALIERLAAVADTVFAVQECTTVLPGRVADVFRASDVMQRYFAQVVAAERALFGEPRFPARRGAVRHLPIRMGDLSGLSLDALRPALASDVFLVFGASYIRGGLCDELVARRAVNIHMGVSPHYRGSSTNFWAMYDRRPDLVGATIHRLTHGLDSGPILFHALPPARPFGPFELGMAAVAAAQRAVARAVGDGSLLDHPATPQDRRREIRYTRGADFTDEVAAEYLARLPSPSEIHQRLLRRRLSDFVRPVVDDPAENDDAADRSPAREPHAAIG